MRFTALTFVIVAALSGLVSAQYELTRQYRSTTAATYLRYSPISRAACAQDCAYDKCGGPIRACVCGYRRSDIDSCVDSTCREGTERSQAQRSVRNLCGGRFDVKEGSEQAPIVEQQEA